MIDYFLFEQINNLAGKWIHLDKLGIFFAGYFQYFIVFLAIILFWKNWRFYFQAILAVVLSRLIFTELIRFLYHRPRPFVSHQVHQLISHDSFSFPSGHAAFFFALAMIVYFYNKKSGCLPPHQFLKNWWGVVFFLAAFLIGLARVFTGIHYPADIVAGALVGIFSGWLVSKFIPRIRSLSSLICHYK